jgi:tight adherence protein B
MNYLILISIGIFISTVLLLESLFFAIRAIRNPERARVKRELRSFSQENYQDLSPDLNIEKKKILSRIGWLNTFLWKLPQISRVEALWYQSNARFPLSVYLLGSLLIFITVFLFLYDLIFKTLFLSLLISAVTGLIPLFLLYRKKKKRLAKFEAQLPDALDLIARALKAGHAFSTGMKMVANEFDDPIGTEFGRTIDEINFGMAIEQALKSLLKRIACNDLKFFAMSLILHREIGGNLAEILGNISRLIRARFSLMGKVKVLSAQGKLSALVLILLPFFVATILLITAPTYHAVLFSDPVGRFIILTAIILQVLGIMVIRRIVSIRV